jgi:OOP family OmpA-OmpF porin
LATRQVIIGVARANFPGFEIVDRTRLARGAPPQDSWLAGVSFALRQLTSLRRGDVRLDGLNMTVTGEAEDLNEYRTVKAALAGGLPKAIKLANNLVAPPSISPHTWTARLEGGQMTLSGHAPDEASASQLMALIRSAAPGLAIDNRLQPASGAPQRGDGWPARPPQSQKRQCRIEGRNADAVRPCHRRGRSAGRSLGVAGRAAGTV